MLHTVLVHVCSGSAQARVQNAGAGEGLMAWRNLVFYYEPRALTRVAGLLQEVIAWDFQKGNLLDRFGTMGAASASV